MDTLSQAVLGSTVAVVVTAGRAPGRAMIYGALLATLPDLDVLQPYDNAVDAMMGHRTWTHSLLVHLLAGPLVGLLFARLDQTWRLRTWMGLVTLVWMTHAFLDALTVYGTWLFWPLQDQPVMGGSIFIIDPAYTLPLLVAAIVCWRRGARAVRFATVGIALSSAYLCWGIYAQGNVERRAVDSLAAAGLKYQQVLATPTPFNSILWRIVAVDHDRYHEGFYSLFDGRQPIRFDSYQRNPGLAMEVPAGVRLDAFRNFTHDYLALNRDGPLIVGSDLRMGLEPYYFFRFVLADEQGGKVPRAASSKIDARLMFSWFPARLRLATTPPIGASRSTVHLGNATPSLE